MKKPILFILFIGGALFLLCSCSSTRPLTLPVDAASVKTAIDSSRWQFIPDMVRPQFGRSRSAGGGFLVTCLPQKLAVYLPYYGRAYGSAAVLSGRGPLDFSSVDFTIERKTIKEDEWQFTITPKDNPEVRTLQLTVFSNGSSLLDVVMNNRSAISFDGSFTPLQ